MSNLTTLPKGDSAWLLRKSIQRIMQQVSVLETNIGSSTTGNSADTQVIFNDNGTLRGDTGLTYDKSADRLSFGAGICYGLLTSASASITGGVAGQGALIERDGASGGATYGANAGNVSVSAPAGGQVRFNVANGVFAGLFDTSGNMGILNSSPFSGNASGLTIGTLGSGSAKQITLQMANCYARIRERNVVNDFAITTNINVDSVLDDNTRPSWMMRLGAGSDLFSVFRAAAASTSFTTLATVNPSGDFNLIGNIVPTSGKGIDFSAGSNAAGMSSELLNDYEEGTFTASITGGTTNPTTPVTTTARYTKIGRQVTVQISFENKNTTGASGTFLITGLPFVSASGFTSTGSVNSYAMVTFTGSLSANIGSAESYITMLASESGAVWNAGQHNAGASRYLNTTLSYTV